MIGILTQSYVSHRFGTNVAVSTCILGQFFSSILFAFADSEDFDVFCPALTLSAFFGPSLYFVSVHNSNLDPLRVGLWQNIFTSTSNTGVFIYATIALMFTEYNISLRTSFLLLAICLFFMFIVTIIYTPTKDFEVDDVVYFENCTNYDIRKKKRMKRLSSLTLGSCIFFLKAIF